MSEQDKPVPEHDPVISALYRKSGELEPPPELDAAVLARARRAARQRSYRWMIPLSTAAVLVLSVTLLLDINDGTDLSREPLDSAPAPQPETMVARKPVPPRPAEPSATPPRLEAKAKRAAPSEKAVSRTAEAKREERALSSLSDEAQSLADLPELERVEADTATSSIASAPAKEALSPSTAGVAATAAIAPPPLEAKPWLEKIRKLLAAEEKDAAKKELEAFRKAYPDYTLPDELKSLLPAAENPDTED